MFDKAGIDGVKQNKRCRIISESVKKDSQTNSSHKSKYFKASKLDQEILGN